MRLAAEVSAVLRQEVRGEVRESESQSSAITIKKGQSVSGLKQPFSISAFQGMLQTAILSLITEPDKASVRGRIGSFVVMS